MISVSFGMFTALWQNVANECRVATMQEEGGKRNRERVSERDTERVKEEGEVGCAHSKTLTKQHCLDGACWRVI